MLHASLMWCCNVAYPVHTILQQKLKKKELLAAPSLRRTKKKKDGKSITNFICHIRQIRGRRPLAPTTFDSGGVDSFNLSISIPYSPYKSKLGVERIDSSIFLYLFLRPQI